ncbi:hypothetical protein ACRYCC_39500 [Actinomadura scrupuli]|uniref:hypothetical protein n=1 Tax=Actinomadura scrupuli TaxID=559629 RepID=UPI003D990A76
MNIQVLTSGAVSAGDIELAREMLMDVMSELGEPEPTARLTLSLLADPAPPRPALAQVVIAQGLRVVRAQAAGTTPEEALYLLRERMGFRLGHARAG